MAWYAYVTQAGVALGLAKKVHGQFPEWGADFATLIVAMVVLNQVVGPPLFKHALWTLAEAGRQPPRRRGKVVVLAMKETSMVRRAMKGLGQVGWQCTFLDASKRLSTTGQDEEDGKDGDKSGDLNSGQVTKLLEYLSKKITDEVKVLVVFLKYRVAKEVAVHINGEMPDCRIILQTLPEAQDRGDEESLRARSRHGAGSGLPPDVIVLNTPDAAAEQLLLSAALSQKTLFPSISNTLEEMRIWERNLGSRQSLPGLDAKDNPLSLNGDKKD
eukprot:CAMPEP_0185273250 /NCGR_PEP_ID=MMETSP1359-20130426/49051_1 /TAXON_ID=552665 /ORGANISM="Bigelowiella longifila, Strain CCMP242" /LENGTH=271 /DNA_ID=CAMNT_0027865805 /DNA_START=419 /DNA_END=1234 /DNA_ORIENTATION=+